MVGRGGGLPPDFFMLRNSLKRSSNAWKGIVLRGGCLFVDLANCGDDILGQATPTFEHIARATPLPVLNSI